MKPGIVGIGRLALVLLAAVAAGPSAAEPAEGVLADLPFLDHAGGYELNEGHVVVDLAIPGGPALPLMVDTGANWSVMTPPAARKLGVSVRRHKSRPYRRATSMGRDLQFWVDTSSSDTGSRSGWEIGILGGNFMENYTVEIDYVDRRVRFLDPRKHPVSSTPTRPDEIVVPIRVQGRRPFAELSLGEGTARFLVDTGAGFDLEISERLAERLGIPITDAEIVEGRNWIGRDRSARTRIESVRIGDTEVGPSELLTTLQDGSTWRHTNQAGSDEAVLGSEFLSRFHVRIDYKHQRMSLVPLDDEERAAVLAQRSQAPGVPAATPDSPGVRLENGGVTVSEVEAGVFRVVAVEPNGPGQTLGLLEEDVILHSMGSSRLSLSDVEDRIVEGGELTVARVVDDVWVDTVLPEPAYSEEDELVHAD